MGEPVVIVLDTHIWIWWAHNDPLLPPDYAQTVAAHEATGLGISAISCWEIAKLVEYNRLTLPLPLDDWMRRALAYPGIMLLELSPENAAAASISQRPGGPNNCRNSACTSGFVGHLRP